MKKKDQSIGYRNISNNLIIEYLVLFDFNIKKFDKKEF